MLLAEIVEFGQTSAPYAVGWGTLALINAGIAQGKNRSKASRLSFHLPSAYVRTYFPFWPFTTPTSARFAPTYVKKVFVFASIEVMTCCRVHFH